MKDLTPSFTLSNQINDARVFGQAQCPKNKALFKKVCYNNLERGKWRLE
jgi:hypothetical protein